MAQLQLGSLGKYPALAKSLVGVLMAVLTAVVYYVLWYGDVSDAIDKQKKQEWNELDIAVDSITKLQPHFTAPWLFQSLSLIHI